MHRRPLPARSTAALLAAAGIVLVSMTSFAADRPRIRRTPAPVPVATPAPIASLEPAASPVVLASPAASMAPPDAGCLGIARPEIEVTLSPATGDSPAPASPTPTPVEDADGTTRIRVPAAGIRLDLPASWLALEGEDLSAIAELPALAEALEGVDGSVMVFLGADILPGSDCTVGADVSVYDLGEALDERLLAIAVDAIALGLEELDEVTGDVKVSSVELPIGTAQRLAFTYDATDEAGVTSWWVRADVLVASGRTLLVAAAAPSDIADEAKPTFNTIAKSLREL